MTIGRNRGGLGLVRLSLLAAAALGAAMLLPRAAAASSEQVLYSFCPQSGCADGATPAAGVILDGAGNLYGTTSTGGISSPDTSGLGVVFKLASDGTETVLYSFCPQYPTCADGAEPYAGLIMDTAGNLYGTTTAGGTFGRGAVFKLAPDGTETVLYSFCADMAGCADGEGPLAGLIMDAAGNLYGTTAYGGNSGCSALRSCGVLFELSPDATGTVWSETVLYSFNGGPADGGNPRAGLLMDAAGNLYGTTFGGGNPGCFDLGCGVVFKLAPDGTETVLYSFCQQTNCADGARSVGGLLMDAAGNLYGTTFDGRNTGCFGLGCGVVFELAPDGTETVLYSFCAQSGCADGFQPQAGLIVNASGNLYGTTEYGGAGVGCGPQGCGVVFVLAPDGTETVLYSFGSQIADGATPVAGLIMDAAGNLYGTTSQGGIGQFPDTGVVFELTPDPAGTARAGAAATGPRASGRHRR